MSKGKIALLIILLLFSSFTFSSNRNIDENNNSQLLDIVPAGSYIGDFTHKEAVGTTIHSGLDIFPSNVDLGYQFTITENPDGSYSSPENIILRDVTVAYDGYVVAHKSYDNIYDLNTSIYGNFYLIKHPKAGLNNIDLYTLYLHLANPVLVNDNRRTPKLGEYVKKGDFLGIMYKGGTSANGYIHLHYAIQTFSNLAETSWIGAIYSSPERSIGDYLVNINGVETTNNEFYDSVYRNPEQYIFLDNLNYIDNDAFSLIKQLKDVDFTNINNTNECNILLSNLSNNITNNQIFESNFSTLYLDTTNENDDQIRLCLFKDIQRELIVRYDINSQQTFIYDKNIDAGYGYSTHQFYSLYDTALELYDFWNSKIGNISNILNDSINIINSNLSTYIAGNLENCVIDWNSWDIEYSLSSNLDLNLHVTDYESNCVIYDRFNAAFLMFNKNSEIYEYSSDLNKYLEIRKYVVDQKIILEEVLSDVNLLNGLTRSISNTADCMALWNDGGSERLVHTENKSYEAKFYGDRCLYFRGNSFIIDYDLETRIASKLYYDTVSNSKYREYMTFRHFVNNLNSAKADERWRNGYDVTLNSSGNVGCTVADNCTNGKITTAQQCDNMFTALTGVNPSVMNANTLLGGGQSCIFRNILDKQKQFVYYPNTGEILFYDNNNFCEKGIFGVDKRNSQVYKIELVTGSFYPITEVSGVSNIATNGDELFFIKQLNVDRDSEIISYNILSGELTTQSMTHSYPIYRMAYNQKEGNLLASSKTWLYTFDISTGLKTVLFKMQYSGDSFAHGDLAIDSKGNIFVLTGKSLYTIDVESQSVRLIGNHGIQWASGLAIDDRDQLFVSGFIDSFTALYKLNKASAQSSLLFKTDKKINDITFVDSCSIN